VFVSTSKEPQMANRTTNARIAAAATTFAAGVLAAFALRPATSSTSSTTVSRPQAAEVRTQVIRRTVHIVRHERPPRPRGGAGTSGARSTSAATSIGGTPSAPRTRVSGASAVVAPTSATAGTPVRTRTSGTAAAGEPSRRGSVAPVRTRTSGSGSPAAGGSGGGKTVRTRTSGGGGDHGGGHDD